MTTEPPIARDNVLKRPEWLQPAQWPFTLRRYEHRAAGRDPTAIHYTDEGNGPALLFVHAGMWSFIWRDVIADLRSDFRCITLDFPGSGLSGGGPSEVDLPTFAPIINGLLTHIDVKSVTFVVHDLGGAVGVVAANEQTDRVAGLVVTNSFAWPPDRRALKIMLRIMGSRLAMAVLGTFRVIPRATRSKAGVGRNFDRNDRMAFFGPYHQRSHSRNFHRVMRSARRSPELFEAALTSLETTLAHLPVLTVFGEKNDPFGFADRWHDLFCDASNWTVQGGNHFPMCDDPDGYTEHLRSWHRSNVAQ